MDTFQTLIPLTPWQEAIFLAICAWIILAARPEVGLALYLSIAGWTRGFVIGSVAQTWILLLAIFVAVFRIAITGGIKPFILPAHKRSILIWIGVWWVWMIGLAMLFYPYFPRELRENVYRNTILYILLPLPVILLIPKEIERVIYFAVAYVLCALVGGWFAIALLNIPISYLLSSPTLVDKVSALGIVNYHWFAYQYAISLVFIAALFMYAKKLAVRMGLVVLALPAVYFLILSSSRQSIFGCLVALLFYFSWVFLAGKRNHRFQLAILALAILFSSYWLIRQAPQILRLGFSADGLLPDSTILGSIIESRSEITWDVGISLIPQSPIWGFGFSKNDVSHNLFIGTIVDQGTVGLIFLLGFLSFWFGEARQAWRTEVSSPEGLWKLAMVSIMVFVLIQSQFSGSTISEWAMWWSTAFLWCLNGLQRLNTGHASAQARTSATRSSITATSGSR